VIRGSSFILRPIQEKDLPRLLGFLNDVECKGNYYPIQLTTDVALRKRFEEDAFWQPHDGHLCIVNEKDEVIGDLQYYRTAHYFEWFELGWILFDEAYRQKGIMSEALGLFVKFLFDTKNINRVQAAIFSENVASIKLARKLGFKLEGTAREAMFHQGKHQDIDIYSLIRREFNPLRKGELS